MVYYKRFFFVMYGCMAKMNEKRRVIASVTNDLTTDQRMHKVCDSLVEAGFSVMLVGRMQRDSAPLARPYATHRMRLLFRRSALFYAEYNVRLLLFLIFHRGDILVANDSDTLLATTVAAKLLGRKLVFDAHELFPESVEIVDKPVVKRVWRWVEQICVPQIDAGYSVCRSIADEYHRRYGVAMGVVRNVPRSDRRLVAQSDHPMWALLSRRKAEGWRIVMYQGMLNVGRGVEEVIEALPLLDRCLFCIVGYGDCADAIARRVARGDVCDRVLLVGKVDPEELPSFTRLADLGVNLLHPTGKNHLYALPNRLFDFIHADVPLLTTDLPEVSRVVELYGVGRVVDDCSPQGLASAIGDELSCWEKRPDKRLLFDRARRELCWEEEEKIVRGIYSML